MTKSVPSQQSGLECGNILSVSPFPEDHLALESILKGTTVPNTSSSWQLHPAVGLSSAFQAMRGSQYSVAVCERDLPVGTWKDLIENIRDMNHAPLVIVTSLWADERLWAEALNLGAYDVLAKPFHPPEVFRGINLACSAWLRKRDMARGHNLSSGSGTPNILRQHWGAADY